jgi:epoxyqueuosine reductase
MTDPGQIAAYIKSLAAELGFDACGIAPAEPLTQEKEHLDEWLAKGYHAGMDYMHKHADKRHDPAQLVENARSVIVFLYNYYPDQDLKWATDYHISCYAFGADYHDIIREKLNVIIEKLKQEIPAIAIRGFVDSAPVLERAWATRAGLGWIGKNSMLISKNKGSYFFIAELITDLELEYDKPMGGNYCGDCSRCMDACPTQAITDLRVVDSYRCISYQTIENKGAIDPSLSGKFENRIFGCDICQQVCPWNRFSTPHQVPAFTPAEELLYLTNQQFESMENELFNKLFRKSALKRTKFDGLKRNIEFVKAQY